MATLITKNSSTASAVPAAGDLVKGELAVNVTDKKVYTKDNSAAVVKLVGSLGNQEANAVAITGGTINGTTIGATTPSTGAFTTASASSGFTGNLTGNVTGNVSGTAANVTGVVAIANGGTGLSALGTGVQSALGQAVTGSGSFVLSTSPSLTTPNLGTPSAAVLTNATGLPLTTGVTGTLGVANGGTGITAFGTGVATALGQNVTGSGGIVLATSPSLTTPNLGTPSAATLTNATGLPISTGVSGLGTGVATALGVAVGSAGAFVVNGGALGTPSSGTLTNATGLPLSTGVTGTLATTNGGTGLTSFTANGVVYASSTSALTTGSALTFASSTLTVNNTVSATNGTNVINVDSPNQQIASFVSGVGYGTLNLNASPLVFQITGSEAMRLTSTGLGIGTSSAGAKLSVVNAISAGNIGTSFQQEIVNNNGAGVGDWTGTVYRWIANNANTNQAYIGAVITSNASSTLSDLVFGVKNSTAVTTISEAMRIKEGNLLVGDTTNSRAARLRVEGAETAYFTGYGSGYGIGLWMTPNASASGGNATAISFQNVSNSTVGSITTSGSATLYNVTSDERLKENIANADSASSLIDSLQVRKFDWKADSTHQRYGFVAQELVQVAPEAVHQPADPEEMMSVDYSKLVPMLVKEIQSLRARLAAAGI